MTQQARERVDALRRADRTFRENGMEVVSVEDGGVQLAMTVRASMTNGADIVHGGWIFLLADTAFAYTATTQLPGVLTTDADIRFHRAARAGDRIVATARVVERSRSTVLIDVVVTGSDGSRVASMRAGGRAPSSGK